MAIQESAYAETTAAAAMAVAVQSVAEAQAATTADAAPIPSTCSSGILTMADVAVVASVTTARHPNSGQGGNDHCGFSAMKYRKT